MGKIKQIYHHYTKWEEFKFGMWKIPTKNEIEDLTIKSYNFMNDLNKFTQGMEKVVKDWKYSCECNLTNPSINKIAWLGQASNSYILKIPESITRKAWNLLDLNIQQKANEFAEEQIKQYFKKR